MASNYPSNQQTGAVTEDQVGILLMNWGWTIGRDRIDAGYDLCIEPETARFGGARFLVQVKGTVRKMPRAGLVAPVARARLRQYVRNPHPVFLIRATSNGQFFWVHVQEWAKSNASHLTGKGSTRIKMNPAQELAQRGDFEAYLDKVLAPSHNRLGALASLAEDRATYLNTLDPRFLVRVGLHNGAEQHEVFARESGVETSLSFQAKPLPANIDNLKDALEFGVPRRVQVDSFHMSGSPLFEALRMDQPHTGNLTIQSKAHPGLIRVYPGHESSLTSQEIVVEADRFSGHKGIAVSNETRDSLFRVDIRLKAENERLTGKSTIGLNEGKLAAVPAQLWTELASAGEWAEQVAEQKKMLFELAFDGRRIPLPATDADDQLLAWLHYVRLLSRIHLIARYLNLNFVLPADHEITHKESQNINFAYALLRGQRLNGGSVTMKMDLESFKPPSARPHGLWATMSIALSLSGQEFGAIPVGIDMPGYVIEPLCGSAGHHVFHPEGGDAWFTYEPDKSDDAFVRRKLGVDPAPSPDQGTPGAAPASPSDMT